MDVVPGGKTTRLGGEMGASYTTVSTPVILNVSSEELEKMPEERRRIVELISATVKEKLVRWEDFRYQLPKSACIPSPEKATVPSIDNLLTQQSFSEDLETITMDPDTGDRRHLTRKQCKEIFESGRVSFPSQAFPDTNHVWQLASWMVVGRNSVNRAFKWRIGGALNHLVVYCPNRVSRKRDELDGRLAKSITEGTFRIGKHIRGIITAFVGLPETRPRNDKYPLRRNAEIQYVRDLCTESELLDHSYYFHESNPTETYPSLASSAFDESDLLKPFRPFEYAFHEVQSSKVTKVATAYKKSEREEALRDILQSGTDDDSQMRNIRAERARVQHIREDGVEKLRDRATVERNRLLLHVAEKHPILSLSAAWKHRWLRNKSAGYVLKWHREQEDENIAVMRSQDLQYAIKFEERRLKFSREAWPDLRKSWLRDRVATRTYQHIYILFDPYRWRYGGEVSTRKVHTSTAFFGWRIVLLFRDMRSFLRNGIYFTVVTNLWRGPVGLRALFSSKDVPCAWKVGETGVTRIHQYNLSLRTRLQAIWRRVSELRAEFEDDTGILGKDAMRWLHFIVNYGFRGCVSTALVVILQPLITLINVPVTLFITVTAVLWAPLSAFLAWCFSWLIYDWRAYEMYRLTYRHLGRSTKFCLGEKLSDSQVWFPVPVHLLKALWGMVEAFINGFGILFHPLFAVLFIIMTCVVYSVRILWEGMWVKFLRQFGRWPARDSFLAKRVAGIGVSDIHYYRLSTDLTIRCICARLEQFELREVRPIIRKAVKQPVKEFETFTDDIVAGLCTGIPRQSTILAKMLEDQKKILDSIEVEFEKREKFLGRLTEISGDKERIRVEEGVQPEEVLRKCQEEVQKVYEERLVNVGNLSTTIWSTVGVEAGDMTALTKALLSDVFSDKFLEPIEPNENKLEIPVSFEAVINVYPGRKLADNV